MILAADDSGVTRCRFFCSGQQRTLSDFIVKLIKELFVRVTPLSSAAKKDYSTFIN